MCGITGIWSNNPGESSVIIQSMMNSIIHRGPDDGNYWQSKNKKITLGHRRLSIIDLKGGAQPMHFKERYTITYNGEIYNYIELRDKLKSIGYSFNSKSDTEVILKAYDKWGTKCLDSFDGMFAFVIYDNLKNELFCARDRFGEKPLYYTIYDGSFYFGSEIKVFWAAGIPKKPNMKMFYNYLANDLVENPNDQSETFYENIFKLKSANYFIYKGGKEIIQKKYWDLKTVDRLNMSFEEACNSMMMYMEKSVKMRLRSDVPVGTSLSGGLDSSTIVGIVSKMQKNNHTFSARFPGFIKDEGEYIHLTSEKFMTSHHDVIVNEHELVPEIQKLIHHQEEPFQSGSIFAQYCVYREARSKGVIVMLDGQGADELLGGYYKDFNYYYRELLKCGGNSEKFVKQIRENHDYNINRNLKSRLKSVAPNFVKQIGNLKQFININVPVGVNKDFHNNFKPLNNPFCDFSDLKSALQYELTNYGLEKLLRYADRNSMAHSVEVRLPFLQHEMVESIFKLKSELFFHEGWSKSILRNTVKDFLPNEIVYRKDKIGFEAPDDEWTESKELYDLYKSANEKLIYEKIINNNYQNRWKIIVASHYLF